MTKTAYGHFSNPDLKIVIIKVGNWEMVGESNSKHYPVGKPFVVKEMEDCGWKVVATN